MVSMFVPGKKLVHLNNNLGHLKNPAFYQGPVTLPVTPLDLRNKSMYSVDAYDCAQVNETIFSAAIEISGVCV